MCSGRTEPLELYVELLKLSLQSRFFLAIGRGGFAPRTRTDRRRAAGFEYPEGKQAEIGGRDIY